MATYELVTAAGTSENSSVKRFTPKYWEMVTDFVTAGSIVTSGPDSAIATVVVRNNKALPGLYFWRSIDIRSHAWLSYDSSWDWTNTVLTFTMALSGIRNWDAATLGKSSITVDLDTNKDGVADSQVYIPLQNYIIAGSGNNVTVQIDWSAVLQGSPPATFDHTVILDAFMNICVTDYEYGQCQINATYTSGQAAVDVRTGNGLSPLIGDTFAVAASSVNISAVSALGGGVFRLTVPSLGANYAISQPCYIFTPTATPLPAEKIGTITFTAISITGTNASILSRNYQAPRHGLGMADDFSYRKIQTPERLCDHLLALGFTGKYNLYWSTTGFERLRWDIGFPRANAPGFPAGRYLIDETNPTFNSAASAWFANLLPRLSTLGMRLVLSISLETLMFFSHDDWVQKDTDGNTASSGYGNIATPLTNPWTHFNSPCSAAFQSWILSMVVSYRAICDSVLSDGAQNCIVQFGEPNWWNGAFNASKYSTIPKPCFYAQHVIDQFASDPAGGNLSLAGTNFSINATAGTITGPANCFANLQAGDYIKIAGFANAGNNGAKPVISVSGGNTAAIQQARVTEGPVAATLDKGAAWPGGQGPRTWTENFTVNAGANTITAATQFTWQYLSNGNVVSFTGFANAGNNGNWVVQSIDGGGYFATFAVSASSLVTESAGASVTIKKTPRWWTDGTAIPNQAPGSQDMIALTWLQGKLSTFLQNVASGYRSSGAAKAGLLFLPDFFLYNSGGIYNIVNRPAAGVAPSVWDFLQLELYTSVQQGDIATQNTGWTYVLTTLGWSAALSRLEYFSGFADASANIPGNPSLDTQWSRITTACIDAITRGASKVYIWALPQVSGALSASDTGHPSYVFLDPAQSPLLDELALDRTARIEFS